MHRYCIHIISILPSWNIKHVIYAAFVLDHTQTLAFHMRIKTPNP